MIPAKKVLEQTPGSVAEVHGLFRGGQFSTGFRRLMKPYETNH